MDAGLPSCVPRGVLDRPARRRARRPGLGLRTRLLRNQPHTQSRRRSAPRQRQVPHHLPARAGSRLADGPRHLEQRQPATEPTRRLNRLINRHHQQHDLAQDRVRARVPRCRFRQAKSKRQPVSVDLRDWSHVIGVVSPSAHQVPTLDDPSKGRQTLAHAGRSSRVGVVGAGSPDSSNSAVCPEVIETLAFAGQAECGDVETAARATVGPPRDGTRSWRPSASQTN